MRCGTSDPLPQVMPAESEEKNKQTAETATEPTSAMEVDRVAIVETTGKSESDVHQASDVKTNNHVNASKQTDITDALQQLSTASLVDGPNVDKSARGDVKQDSEKPQEPQMQADKMDVATTTTTTEKTTDVVLASDRDELEDMQSDTTEEDETPLLFRCISCKRCAHYQHRKLLVPEIKLSNEY